MFRCRSFAGLALVKGNALTIGLELFHSEHGFDAWCVNVGDILCRTEFALALLAHLGQNVASERGSAFDFAAFFDLETLCRAAYRLHFRHELPPL